MHLVLRKLLNLTLYEVFNSVSFIGCNIFPRVHTDLTLVLYKFTIGPVTFYAPRKTSIYKQSPLRVHVRPSVRPSF